MCESSSQIPDYLTLILSDAVDFDCGIPEAACDNEPSPLSPFSSLNGEWQLNYSESLSAESLDPCIRWYESDPIPYGDFLASTIGSPDCIVASGYTITFAAEVVFVSGPPVHHVTLYTFLLEDTGIRYYSGVSITEETEDHSWLCDSDLTSDEWENPGFNFTATTGLGYPDAYDVRFNLGYCFDIILAEPVTIQMRRSVGGFTP